MLHPRIQHHTTSSEFLKELGFLHELTKDERFMDTVRAVAEYGLIDEDGNWRRDPATNVLPPPEFQQLKDRIFFMVQSAIRRGMSLRMACAECVVKQRISGHSFEAVCKDVERIYRTYVEAGETLISVGSRIMSRVEDNWPDQLPDSYVAWRRSGGSLP
ncbi:hypothetical protein [Microvirga massiliensis]|uniref:hypothetical protein n=1 Tax=Microvirga massiliensis TaxID=1033741 RepID=UPI00062BC1C5|nr:hypothetical protein [Microvirga massiliensis]